MNLLEDLVRGGDRFGEYRNLVWNRIGNRNQVAVGKTKEFCKGAVAPEDSEHCAIGTMARETAGAYRASPASRVDLANDAFSPDRGVVRFDYAADEFMTRHSPKLHVAAGDLEVGSADAGERDADDTLARRRNGIGIVGAKFQIAIEYQRAHRARFKQKSSRLATARQGVTVPGTRAGEGKSLN